jgi:hypothetical protein
MQPRTHAHAYGPCGELGAGSEFDPAPSSQTVRRLRLYCIQQQKNDLLCFPISAKSQVFCRSAQIVKTKLASAKSHQEKSTSSRED